ncbi:lysis protein [Salmonella enterica]|uniref:lysis protein n=1 Tax=Salmonella enterica TaxID=28901 RepID=UPI00107E2CB9|nr:lysis protein [Salmonella enterica]EAA8353977.1 lysis protein [Salmonella enterica subsp. enterica serovar Poona]EAN3245522.1 lysis protein [Salmonella enterica subsp. enterica serovar Give]EAP4216896.1 lysis protein [Salmonella enterica subsp. enterica serovar Pomona]EAU5127263.1 lysis protein [Salmonella enterica subsp. enterica serovar Infantis]ECS5235084.1 lysis protein [Salmonella enterica subsp. enterica serovar Sundsvall]EDW4672657.1 lysis protein [Salmonella enterica subsp. salamae
MNRITTGVIVSLLILAAALGWTTSHYHGNAVKYKDQRDTATHNLKMANETISDMQTRQRDVAALDAKYTKELADAQNQIDALERDVAAGRRRLYVNATCSAVSAGKTTSPPGVDDGTGPRLNPTAERNYYTLRKRIEKARKQIDGLQSYIKSACQ